MTDELGREELLKWLYNFWNLYQLHDDGILSEEAEQAYEQIREMIQKPEVTEEFITSKAFLLQGAANNFVALRQSLTKTLIEAGVEMKK